MDSRQIDSRQSGSQQVGSQQVGSQQELLRLLQEAGQTVSFCESLTAGLVAATFAEVPGASTALRGGLVTYATEVKVDLAGVDESVIVEHGAVSAQCAEAMARGARQRCTSDWALAVTGVAGPDEQDGHPVGEVWIGIAGPDGTVESVRAFNQQEQRECAGLSVSSPLEARARIRKDAVQRCFEVLILRLSQSLESK